MSYKTVTLPAIDDGLSVADRYKGKPEAVRLGFRIEELKRDIDIYTRPGFKNRVAGRLFTAKRKQDAIEAGEAAVLAMRQAGYSRTRASAVYGKAYIDSQEASDRALADKIDGMRAELAWAMAEHDRLLGVGDDTDYAVMDDTPETDPVGDSDPACQDMIEGADNEI